MCCAIENESEAVMFPGMMVCTRHRCNGVISEVELSWSMPHFQIPSRLVGNKSIRYNNNNNNNNNLLVV